MKISSIKPASGRQLLLFDRPLGNHGHRRFIIGNLTEELIASLFNANRHKLDSSCDYCPDLSIESLFIECKAAGRNKETFIYQGRLEKDREFSKSHNLMYAILHHTTNTLLSDTVEELETDFLMSIQCLYLVPFEVIDNIASSLPEEKLNSKYGRHANRQLYGSGVRLRLSMIESWKFFEWEY